MKNQKSKMQIILIIAFTLLVASPAFSQMFDPSGKKGGGFGGPRKGMQGGFHEKNLENLRLLKMLEILELDEEQTVHFIAIFSQFRREMKELGDSTAVEVSNLAELLNAVEFDEAKVLESIEKIQKIHESRFEAMIKLREKGRSILTVKQLGKLIIFEERFDRELLESLQGFRGRGKPDPGESNR